MGRYSFLLVLPWFSNCLTTQYSPLKFPPPTPRDVERDEKEGWSLIRFKSRNLARKGLRISGRITWLGSSLI
ncbi:hypothetical protein BGZ63DRAFT_388517 [Mariannaea sp. PMI_226]|nr:hypothetical protein BGZ63DRAFT_388517 [Mariannaea sp. PMI_226]